VDDGHGASQLSGAGRAFASWSSFSERRPDVVVEDDCESIGAEQMAHRQLSPELRARIVNVVVPEFGGLAHLPDDPQELLRR
jgi:hypothetical protein